MKTKMLIAYRPAGWGDSLLNYAHWLWAKNNNCCLKIAGYNSLYLKNKNKNAFTYFFDTPNTIEGVNIINKDLLIIPAGVLRIIIGRIRRLVTLGILKKEADGCIKLTNNIYLLLDCKSAHPDIIPFFDNLKLKSHIQLKVEKFVNERFKGKKVLGLHIKGDYKHSSSHRKYWLDENLSLTHICNSVR